MTATTTLQPARAVAALGHLACILALMWSALINGQAFFFPDTTSYIRAADIVAFKASHGAITTAWTQRYEKDLEEGEALRHSPKAAVAARPVGNDIRSGNIMSGRSPYIGALLWLAYVLSDFWLFILLQAATAYALIRLTLRHFGIDRPRVVAGVVALLAVGTALPYFNALLLADALAAFGILAFLLLATARDRLARHESAFLWLVLLFSLVSHLTHIVMMLAMLAVGALLVWRRIVPMPARSTWLGFVAVVVIALGSVALTSFVVTRVFHKAPQLVPLMTARFIADGPGRHFVEAGCPGEHFAVCEMPMRTNNAQLFLWSTAPNEAVYLAATPRQRARMSAEDTRFALAVLRAYPLQQGAMLAYNTLHQVLEFPALGYNETCFAGNDCGQALPASVRAELQGTIGGRGLWPERQMTWLYYAVAGLALLAIVTRVRAAYLADRVRGRDLVAWLSIASAAMLACAFFGGAISEPQYRYQGRLIWLVPLFAAIVVSLGRKPVIQETVR